MNFRSSMYMPKESENPYLATWFEAHAMGDDYVIARLSGISSELRPPRLLFFSRAAREVDRPKTLPQAAIIVDTATEPKEAVAKIMALEVELQSTYKMIEIGECYRRNVWHYVELMNDKGLPEVPLLPAIIETAQEYAGKIMGLYVRDKASKCMLDEVRLHMDMFRNRLRADVQPT